MDSFYVEIDLPGDSHPRTGYLLAQAGQDGSLPPLQIYDSIEYLLALKRHRDGTIEHAVVWVTDDAFDGRCLPVTRRSDTEIRADLRRFLGDDPRADALVRESPLRWRPPASKVSG